ncbi:acyltransferase family protein [Enterovibrio norvegicus]|uniref:acyltransferase family protein n=1 Tax=Enterovibrio norvegicus TaxID=188144 RepID=UPI001F535199|nr:acyltransferase [Enterovibrio norvegicus]
MKGIDRIMFLQSISNYRALAIMMIVSVHVYPYGLENTTGYLSVIKNLLSNSTALFVFISGFMFHHVFMRNYNYKKFIKSKLERVFSPYLFLSTLAIALLFITNNGYFSENFYDSDTRFFSSSDSSFITIVKYYLTGRMLTAYWYIPFAILLFVCAPLHRKYGLLSMNKQIAIFLLFSIVSLFVHRSMGNINPFQMLIYFTPFYLLGILFSKNREVLTRNSLSRGLILMALTVLLAIYQYSVGHQGNYIKPLFQYGGVDIMFIQKIFMATSLYYLLDALSFKNKCVDYVSDVSFAIYFLHPWVLTILKRLPFELQIPTVDVFKYFLVFAFVIISSVFIAIFTHKILNSVIRTKYIIGY